MKNEKQIKSPFFSIVLLLLGCFLLNAFPTQAATFNVKEYGAIGDDKTDNTAAFSRCIEAVIAAGGGKMFLPDGVYQGRIIIPAISKPLPSWITIEISGESVPTPIFGTIGNFPLRRHGTIIQCLEKSGPSVISVDKSTDALYGSYSAVHVIIRNLDIRSYDNPAIGGVDLQWALQCQLENVFINTDIYNVQSARPTHGTKGLITPESNNAALTILRNVQVTGYHTGILVSEHTDADNIILASNINGLEFVFAHHASHFRRVGAYRNTNHVVVSGKHGFQIEQLNTENSGPGQTDEKNVWQKTVYDLADPDDLGTADITYWVVVGNVGAVAEFKINGGRNIRTRRIGSAP